MDEDEIEGMEGNEETDIEHEMGVEDFQGRNYIKNPEVGSEITFVVEKVVDNKKTTGTTKEGVNFDVGLKFKDGSKKRYDIHTDQGVYTINTWEVFFKLFSRDGMLLKYGKEHKGFSGAKISIKRLYNGNHASAKITDLMKLMTMSEIQAKEYQDIVKAAKKENRLYDVKLLN